MSTGLNTGSAIVHNDAIGQVCGHDEIVLDDEGSLLGVHDKAFDDFRGGDTLLGIQVSRRLIDLNKISNRKRKITLTHQK